jgi:hypothetical protein
MNKFKIIQAANRRAASVDRRVRIERRGRSALGANTIYSVETLRELLDEAHARIRLLEMEMEKLKNGS